MHGRYVPLFWQLLVPNATMLCVVFVAFGIEPPDGRIPVLAVGLALVVVVDAVLLRRAITPLTRLTGLMRIIDPLQPGHRLPMPRARSEVSLLATAFNDMLDRLELERREAGMRALSEREGERRRLAAELHDQLGQTLTALALQVDRLADRAPSELGGEVCDVRDGLLGSVEEVRRITRQLRPEALDTLGLVPALTNLSDRLGRRTGVTISRRLRRDLPEVGDDAEVVIFRVAQESITNALRHANAASIEITLEQVRGKVVLSVCDDGVGHDAAPGSNGGIRGMRERALSIGAELRIQHRTSGSGTKVILEVPVGRA